MSQNLFNQSDIETITPLICDFVNAIGIPVRETTIVQDTFLPGIRIVEGEIWIDKAKMLSPGDILHEAGHLAIVPPEIRKQLTDTVVINETTQAGEEMGAIAWSWAALVHLNIAPEVVFHPQGYKGGSDSLIENFSAGRYIGVPILHYKGMSLEPNQAEKNGGRPFPYMIKWILE